MQNLGDFKAKSFWERPEGTTGMVLACFLALAVGTGLWFLLPVLIVILQNLAIAIGWGIAVVGLAAVGTFLGALLFSKRSRRLWSYLYMNVSRWLTSFVVSVDPIGIMKDYVDELKDNLAMLDGHRELLRGQENKLEVQIRQREKAFELEKGRAEKSREGSPERSVYTRQMGRLLEFINRLKEILGKIKVVDQVISKMRQASELMIIDLNNQVELKEAEYKSIGAAYSAFKNAMKIIAGSGEGKELYDMADDYILESCATKMAAIELGSENIKGILDSIDLDNAIFADQGEELLKKLEAQTASLFSDQPAAVAPPVVSNVAYELDQPPQSTDQSTSPRPRSKYFER